MNAVAWYNVNSDSTQTVGTKQANQLGLYDMSGNVYEFCSDWIGNYNSISVINPTGPSTGLNRVKRGGSWHSRGYFNRVSRRDYNDPSERRSILGAPPCACTLVELGFS